MLDVLFLTPSGETLPSVRFRVLPFVEAGRASGLAVDWRRVPKAIHKRLAFLFTLPRARVMVIQQKLFAPYELALIRRRCQRLVYDVDDALWALHPSEIGQPGMAEKSAKIARRFADTCARVDLVVAGNSYLAGRAREHQPNIFVLPTLIDTRKYTPAPPDAAAVPPFRVGWMGTSGNLWFLPEVLRELAPHQKRLDIRVVADKPYEGELEGLVRFERWGPALEAEQLRGFQCGLMPLTDDEYTRGKCGFKILQYMASGVVPIASCVGFNREIISHGVDGFLVQHPGDWAEYVLRLADDLELLERMAWAARRTAEDRFSLEARIPGLWSALGVGTGFRPG
ncbi:MAG: glycosyltransferase [Proteobacteria bacterium]|nr:glycosyltransferase [Pseudomonadota bacterium]MBU1593952.1 glycosyltransferase [Pseudomonadota bacterium]